LTVAETPTTTQRYGDCPSLRSGFELIGYAYATTILEDLGQRAYRLPVNNGTLKRQTKIVCTIGPATSSQADLEALIEAGMNVARLNFAHGDQAQHGAVIARIRALAERLAVPVGVLQDLSGPKVRIGTVAGGSITLEASHPLVLTTVPVEGSTSRVSVSYANLPREVESGDALLLADGAIQLRVERVTEVEIHCRVVVGGRLSSRKGVNVPSGLSGLPILSEKDLDDLRFGLEQGVDYVGLSFVRTVEDVHTARAHIAALGSRVPVIAKIETQAALDQVSSPHPTRAEVADVAHAILDGSDAVMLSEETAVGEHPVRAVEVMAAIARETEAGMRPDAPAPSAMEAPSTGEEAVVQAACQLATRLRSDVIVTITTTGETARFAAKCRTRQPILALTSDRQTYRRLALVRGVVPLFLPAPVRDAAEPLEAVRSVIHERGWRGKHAVLVTPDRVWRATL
jgi:pyruvate kinase